MRLKMRWRRLDNKWLIAISVFLAALAVGYANLYLGDGQPLLSREGSEDLNLPEKIDFNYDIRPILSQNCFVCHGPDSSSRKADLRLDNSEGATAIRKDGRAAIVPGNIHKSLLVSRISSTDPEFQMPPPESKKTLGKREIALIERWIKQGAVWKPHWAFIKPELPNLSADQQRASISDIIDYFIDLKLELKKLGPSAPATKNALIRRVSYLLTGLPPEPSDVKTFISDSSTYAYTKMVDQYLSSPHFGERWARHWMDLVRYGEHKGHEFDYPISGAWHYRDYLIRAFNQDVGYDLFVKEHLAGDLLDPPRYNPEEGFNESILGTAYFFLGEGKHSPVNVKLEESDQIDNVIDVTSKTFQALTVGCARCHDHKFDPIPTADYYAMYGMFESARIGPLPARTGQIQAKNIDRLKQIQSKIRTQIGKHLASEADIISPQAVENLKQYVQYAAYRQANQQTDLNGVNVSQNYQVLGDFRKGDWKGWYTTGWAFGESPLQGAPVFDRSNQLVSLVSGVASSRLFACGITGALRSPNFIIEHDSIAVRAAGLNSTIRIIVDNFQLIQYPLYGGLEKLVNTPQWQTYTFDVTMLKGHKAYVEFIPGNYGNHQDKGIQQIYRISPEDYIEIEYAVAFDGALPRLPKPDQDIEDVSEKTLLQAINDWVHNRANSLQIRLLNQALTGLKDRNFNDIVAPLHQEYQTVASKLYDTTHFLGISEGDAVFSPVFIRGSIDNLSEEKVPRRFLSALGADTLTQQGSGRLAWAASVVDSNNPLTARVVVNRIWHHLFGKGIVETVDNFGLQGKLPSHPELLDYLAVKMIEEGWSMKAMIKNILMSQTFQRSTTVIAENQKVDPENNLLHHFPIRRLEAEAIRDGILAVTGNLDLTMFGEPVPIHLTKFMTGRGRPKESGPLDGAGRRSIYLEVRRNFLSPMMLVFDMPIPFSTFGKRNTTNVPAQSLTLMNDPFVYEQARSWAENLVQNGDMSMVKKIQKIYTRAFSRPASLEELREAEVLLENLAKAYNSTLEEVLEDPQLWADYCHSVFNLKEFIHLL